MDSYYGNGSSKINANFNMINMNIYNMVGGFKHFLFSIIYGIILPIH
jgi:hypothetical protein